MILKCGELIIKEVSNRNGQNTFLRCLDVLALGDDFLGFSVCLPCRRRSKNSQLQPGKSWITLNISCKAFLYVLNREAFLSPKL